MTETNEQRWNEAVAHAKSVLRWYREIRLTPGMRCNTMFAEIGICNEIDLYEKGDRSEALLKSLEETE